MMALDSPGHCSMNRAKSSGDLQPLASAERQLDLPADDNYIAPS